MPNHRSEIFYDKDFLGDVRRLPAEARRKLSGLIELLGENAFEPRLLLADKRDKIYERLKRK
ncbi:MAG: hypothetical protein V1704_02345 [Candidatus Vogelbacteria bacterium]